MVQFMKTIAVCAALFSASGATLAQNYPVKPITIVVANNTGIGPDLVARIIAPHMSQTLGQPIVIDNKPGADGILGYEYVAKNMPADGYTPVLVATSGLVTLPLLVKELRFDALRDLPPVMDIVELKLVLGGSSKLPWKSFNEMVAYAKANPGKLNYGASGGQSRLLTEAIIRSQGLNVVFVPYKGAGPFFNALVAGDDVHFGLIGESSAISFGEKFRPLAVTGDQASASFKGVPTFKELNQQIPGVGYALHVRAGTPRAIVARLNEAGNSALKLPSVKADFAKLQMDVVIQSTEAAEKNLAYQAKLYADIAKAAGVQPQ